MQKHHGLRGQLSGWGATHNSGPQHPQLKWARLPVSQPGTCPQLNGAPYAHTQFCSDVVDYRGGRGPPTQANQGHDACKGDSGSPFIADHTLKNTPVQLGIVSYGRECGGRFPTVYTHVGSYVPWIKYHTGVGGG
ncbi:coagulation factor IX-like [Frankliniella occidentalis]|uniref:Coagulation factor IX-like n=1 Tax=Frankliniella occidentalis TaxID=133901 RepID=A0A9C6TZP1_FRAOC|nr:coagulation factor IX-like [Frankliniella occidentalis]